MGASGVPPARAASAGEAPMPPTKGPGSARRAKKLQRARSTRTRAATRARRAGSAACAATYSQRAGEQQVLPGRALALAVLTRGALGDHAGAHGAVERAPLALAPHAVVAAAGGRLALDQAGHQHVVELPAGQVAQVDQLDGAAA